MAQPRRPLGGAVSASRAKPAPACDSRSRSHRPETGGDQRRMAGSQPLSLIRAAARFAIASFLSEAILSAAPEPIASRTASMISVFGTLTKYSWDRRKVGGQAATAIGGGGAWGGRDF